MKTATSEESKKKKKSLETLRMSAETSMQLEHTVQVAVIADTHDTLDPRIVDEIARCDYAVHAGDIGCAAVLEAMRPRRGKVLAIRGNNDTPEKWPATEAQILNALPSEASLDLPGGRLVVVHGDAAGSAQRRHDRLREAYSGARAVIYGHSHHAVIDRSQIPWILNPGAAGRVRTYGGPSCLLLSASVEDWRVEIRRFEPLREMHMRKPSKS